MSRQQTQHLTIVGAGLSGAVLARCLAEKGYRCLVVEERTHVGGNCHTARDPASGIMIHRHGPHIFHTDRQSIWDFMNRFCTMMPYRHRVIARHGDRVFSLPINLLTINQFFTQALAPAEAADFLRGRAVPIDNPANFEEQALSMLGRELYEAFFEGYTRKQWGVDPKDIPANVLKRLPVRFSYDDGYFSHRYQGIPAEGYTAAIAAMLRHPNIDLVLGQPFRRCDVQTGHLFYSGPIDRYFDHRLGRLPYRSLRFETIQGAGDIQGTAVMNYVDADVPYTRITEHKHFAPWDDAPGLSVAHAEYSHDCGPDDTPYYPLRMARDESLLNDYLALARNLPDVTFIGRLGTYSYIDMDVAILRAIDVAEAFDASAKAGRGIITPA